MTLPPHADPPSREAAVRNARDTLALGPLIVDSQGSIVFDSLVKPSRPIPGEASDIHGITNAAAPVVQYAAALVSLIVVLNSDFTDVEWGAADRSAPLTWTSKLPYLKVSDNIQVARASQARISQGWASNRQEVLMEQDVIYVGVDVAKAHVDVAIRPSDDGWVVANDDAGLRQLVSRLKTLEPHMVVLEASGGVELPLVAALAVEELPVVVVNPRQVRDFARATGKLAKTDALDAFVLAHFGEAVKPPVRPLRDAETQALNSLATRRHQVMSMLVSEKHRLNTAVAVAVRSSIEAHIEWLQRELDDLDTDLRQTLQQSPAWREKDNLLPSVPGVGEQIIPHTPGPPAGVGHAGPPTDRRAGRSGSLQPRQRHPERTPHSMGRTSQGACRAVHGSAGGSLV